MTDHTRPAPAPVSLTAAFASFAEHWAPRIAGELNGQHVKVVKFQGAFVWHRHEHEDEMFLVVGGRFRMDFRERHVWLEQGEFLINRLLEMAPHQHVGEVRGKGMMMIVEVVDDKGTKAKFDPSLNVGPRLQAATRARGLIVRCSNDGIAISPPLILTRDEATRVADAIQGAIIEVLG